MYTHTHTCTSTHTLALLLQVVASEGEIVIVGIAGLLHRIQGQCRVSRGRGVSWDSPLPASTARYPQEFTD